MADLTAEEDGESLYTGIDIDALLSKVQQRPLTMIRRKSVLLAPDFTKRLKGEEVVNEGGDLTLTFKVNGVPKPTLRLFKDDEEVKDHARITVEEVEGEGGYRLTLQRVNKGDEAAYRCRAENVEGSASCCFYLTVKGKPKSPKRDSKGGHRRTVSFPTMFSTIVEKVEEEEKAGIEASVADASPLTHFYDSLTMKGRSSWPSFLGEWAFVNGSFKARGGSAPPENIFRVDRQLPQLGKRGRAQRRGRRPPLPVLPPGRLSEQWGGPRRRVRGIEPPTSGPLPITWWPCVPGRCLFLPTGPQPAQRGRALPPDVDRPPAEVASRGETGSTSLTSRQPVADRNNSRVGVVGKGGVVASSGKGVTSSEKGGVTSSGKGGVASSVAYSGGKGLVGRKGVPSSAGVEGGREGLPTGKISIVAKTVGKDKAKPASSSPAVSKNGPHPSPPPPPPSSSSTVASLASKFSSLRSSSGAQTSHLKTNQVPVSPSSELSQQSLDSSTRGDVRSVAASCSEPGKDKVKEKVDGSSGSGDVSRSFSLPTGSQSAGRAVVRGPLGALITSGGDAAKRTLTPTTRISSRQKKSTSPSSPSVTVTPKNAQAKSVNPPRLLLPENVSDKMCDHCKAQGNDCECGEGIGASIAYLKDRKISEENSALAASSAADPLSAPSSSSHSSVSSPTSVSSRSSPSTSPDPSSIPSSPSLPCPQGYGLLEPEFKREEREPTPIPPDVMMVTHVPTGKSIALEYRCDHQPTVVGVERNPPQPDFVPDPVNPIPEPEKPKAEETESKPQKAESPKEPNISDAAKKATESVPAESNLVWTSYPPTVIESKLKPMQTGTNPKMVLETSYSAQIQVKVGRRGTPLDKETPLDKGTPLDKENPQETQDSQPETQPKTALPKPKRIPEPGESKSEPVLKDDQRKVSLEREYSEALTERTEISMDMLETKSGELLAQLKLHEKFPLPAENLGVFPLPAENLGEFPLPAENLGEFPPPPEPSGAVPPPQTSPTPASQDLRSPSPPRPTVQTLRCPPPSSFLRDRAGLQAQEALFFDPVHHELIHVKSLHHTQSPPPRTRSAEENSQQQLTARPGPSRRSPGAKQDKRKVSGGSARPKSDSGVYACISTDPERHLVWQYFRELVFVICLLTFLGLVFKVHPHVFVLVVLVVHLTLFLSRKYIFVRK
ncbi:hypothetical protein ACOMHN_014930 [Nucella lapillus]